MSRNWKIPPYMVVCSLVMLVVAYMAANLFVGHSVRTIDPRVRMEIRSGAGEQALKETEVRRRVVVTATDGEVARTTDRVGEAEALALTTSLYAATEQLKGRTPLTANDLLAGVAAESLLPPGLSLTDGDGAIASAHASLFVRYRAAPFGVEVVSLGICHLPRPQGRVVQIYSPSLPQGLPSRPRQALALRPLELRP